MRAQMARLRRRVGALLLGHREVADSDRAVFPDELGFDSADYSEYGVSGWRLLGAALKGEKVTRSDVFVDLGCGKGRVVVQAAIRHPFGRVIGVELSPDLVRFAEENVELNRGRLGAPVELVTANATEYRIPDDVTYVYIYNSFSGETFARVLENVMASVDANPRRLVLLYGNPFNHEVVVRDGRWRLVRDLSPRHPLRVYESVPSPV